MGNWNRGFEDTKEGGSGSDDGVRNIDEIFSTPFDCFLDLLWSYMYHLIKFQGNETK